MKSFPNVYSDDDIGPAIPIDFNVNKSSSFPSNTKVDLPTSIMIDSDSDENCWAESGVKVKKKKHKKEKKKKHKKDKKR